MFWQIAVIINFLFVFMVSDFMHEVIWLFFVRVLLFKRIVDKWIVFGVIGYRIKNVEQFAIKVLEQLLFVLNFEFQWIQILDQ